MWRNNQYMKITQFQLSRFHLICGFILFYFHEKFAASSLSSYMHELM